MSTYSERLRSTPPNCVGCARPFRHWNASAKDEPGTVQHAGRGLCRRCYGWRVLARNQAGASIELWHTLIVAQSGRCASCGDPMRVPYADHNHVTGAIRGLLCKWCNFAEGHLRGDPARARALADYLERHLNAR